MKLMVSEIFKIHMLFISCVPKIKYVHVVRGLRKKLCHHLCHHLWFKVFHQSFHQKFTIPISVNIKTCVDKMLIFIKSITCFNKCFNMFNLGIYIYEISEFQYFGLRHHHYHCRDFLLRKYASGHVKLVPWMLLIE